MQFHQSFSLNSKINKIYNTHPEVFALNINLETDFHASLGIGKKVLSAKCCLVQRIESHYDKMGGGQMLFFFLI